MHGVDSHGNLAHPDSPRLNGRVSLVQVKLPYHIRVLIPCYKEELDIVQKTVIAARTAILPENVLRTIYLCDDGKDPEKRAWINALGPDVVYVSGRYRKKGEMNGKSGNLNNVARQLYPAVRNLPNTSLTSLTRRLGSPDASMLGEVAGSLRCLF